MKLHWMVLANAAEAHEGLVSLLGAGWDTINAGGPPPEGFPGVAPIQGTLVVRILFHPTEAGKEYPFLLTVIGEDGQDVFKVEGTMNVPRATDLPVGWDQGANMVINLTGVPLPQFGLYRLGIEVGAQFLGELPFRVVKRY